MSRLIRHLKVLDDGQGQFMKVAFASSDRKTVNQHFGAATGFDIYGANIETSQLLQVAQFGQVECSGDDKLKLKLQLLDGCIAVYCRACGASAVKQLQARGIKPVKVSEGTRIKDLLAALVQELREGPGSWLARAIEQQRSAEQIEHWDEQ